MTEENLIRILDNEEDGIDEFLKFERIPAERRLSNRADLHAFMLLDHLLPGTIDILGGAEHDEIYLHIEIRDLAPVVTEEQVVDLKRCGLRYSEMYDGLAMYV